MIRIFLGALFVLSGVLKMTDLISFFETIQKFDILPFQFISVATILIPSLEIVCGLFLALGLFKRGVISILVPLMAIFTIAISINLYRGAEIDCGCFGPLSVFSTISIYSVLFDLGLIGLLQLTYVNSRHVSNIFEHLKIVMIFTFFMAFVAKSVYSHEELVYIVNVNNMPVITWIEANDIMANENAILVDARPTERYLRDHVPGAISVPFDDLDNAIKNLDGIDKTRPILVYCDGLDCTASQKVANKFVLKGYTAVYDIAEGWERWSQN